MQLRFSQIHVTILNFVLVAALAIVSAMCVRDIITRSVSNEPDAPAESPALRKASSGLRSRAFYNAIVKRDIFNEAPQVTAPAPVVEENLNIKLIGTSLLSRSKPYAIIEDPSGNESLYQVGENIPDAGRLVSVETNRAIIDRGGHRVAIEIPSSDMPEAAAAPSLALGRFRGLSPAILRERQLRLLRDRGRHGRPVPAASDDTDNSNGDNNDNGSSDDNNNSKLELEKLGPGKFAVSRAEVQQTMENPSQFFSQMRAMPHFVDGKTDGFSISQVVPGSVFDQIGLQNGDLLTSIDGQPVTNPMQAMGLMQSMKTQSALDLTINRGGAPTSVHLDLR